MGNGRGFVNSLYIYFYKFISCGILYVRNGIFKILGKVGYF